MGISIRDRVATILVGAAALLAVGWFADVLDLHSIDVAWITVAVLALGVPPSAMAVVPGFAGLIHGSRWYLAVSSALGVAASAAALLTIANRTEGTLVALVGLTIILWAAATARHAGAAGGRRLEVAR